MNSGKEIFSSRRNVTPCAHAGDEDAPTTTSLDSPMTHMAPLLSSTDEERRYYALNQRVYRVFAWFYDLVASPLRNVRHRVAGMIGIDAHTRVLDVATGTGSQARAFAERAGEVVGLDLSEAMLRVARDRNRASNLTFVQGDATQLPFGDASFDVASISLALHEMPMSIRQRVLAEVVRVVRPGGAIVVIEYARPPGALGDAFYRVVKTFEPDQYVDFMRSDLHALLRGAGIEVRDERTALFSAIRIVLGTRAAEPATRAPPQ
jgi:demethylmenaquinone methyltransferase/2-methoxy-6-polyprenyl-1,4-benzoquinol methylase